MSLLNKAPRFRWLGAMTALLALTMIAASAHATVPNQPIKPVTEVFHQITSRPDYRLIVVFKYDRSRQKYDVVYLAKDGVSRHFQINAITGKPIANVAPASAPRRAWIW